MFSTWICIADIFHILAKFMMEKFTTKSFSWFICRSCSFLNHWAPVLIPQHTASQPLLDVSVWIRTCASGLITNRLLQSSKLLTHQSSTFFVMGVCFTKVRQDCVCFRDTVCCCCKKPNCTRTGSTAWMVEESVLLVLSNTQALILYLSYLYL